MSQKEGHSDVAHSDVSTLLWHVMRVRINDNSTLFDGTCREIGIEIRGCLQSPTYQSNDLKTCVHSSVLLHIINRVGLHNDDSTLHNRTCSCEDTVYIGKDLSDRRYSPEVVRP